MTRVTLPNNWTKKTYNNFVKELKILIDKDFKDFTSHLVNTQYNLLGIRTNILENIAKKIYKTEYLNYLKNATPHSHEEVMLYGMLISYIKAYDLFLPLFWSYLEYIDNWATCDQIVSRLKIIAKNKEKFLPVVKSLLNTDKEYYVRVGIVILMDYYLDEKYLTEIYSLLDSIKHNGYYVHMAIAWLLSIAYIKFPEETEDYLKNNQLKPVIINKAIQKIRDSKRVSRAAKDYLLKYKIDEKTYL